MREADQLQPGHLERSQGADPEEAKMTVADYLLFKLHSLGNTALHTIRGMEQSPLALAANANNLIEPLFWETIQEAVWAGQSLSRRQGFCAVFGPESLLPGIFDGLISTSYELVPMLYVVQRSIRVETKELCGLPLSVQEKGIKDLQALVRKYSASYFFLNDRNTAAARIDKAIDASLELLQPAVLDLPDEVAISRIPPHTYRKTVFNYEDQDLIKTCWHTILSRLEQAQAPLFVLGRECWPPLWHHTLLILSREFQAEMIAAEALHGHLGSYHPEKFLGYFALSSLNIDLKDSFDSLFVFGVPSDCPWLEMIATHHDVSAGVDHELFTLNSSGISFGDGRECMPPVCLKEFFCHAPPIARTAWAKEQPHASEHQPSWHALASTIKDDASPLFVPHDEQLISFLIQFPPFAKIFIQPEHADDAWAPVSIASWAHGDPSSMIFTAGTLDVLSRTFGRLHRHRLPHHLIFLLYDSEDSSQEAAALLSATPLTNEEDVSEWLSREHQISHHPGIIWMSREEG